MTALLAAEWVKVRSVRSTVWTLGLAFALSTGLAYVFGAAFRSGWDDMPPDRRALFDPIFSTFYSLTIGQLALVVLAVLVVTSEYSTGTIRYSLIAVPQRSRYFAAKVGAGALLALAVAVVTVAATFTAAQAGLGDIGITLGSDDALAATIGACLYLVLIYLFATGVAVLLRGAIPTLGILMPLLFLGSQGLGNLPQIKPVAQYLPDQAGMLIMHIVPPGDPQFARDYGPWTGLAIMALWAAAALAAGYVAVRRRDA